MLETGEGEMGGAEVDAGVGAEAGETGIETAGESRITSLPWPPAPSLGALSLSKTPAKGILVSHGFRYVYIPYRPGRSIAYVLFLYCQSTT